MKYRLFKKRKFEIFISQPSFGFELDPGEKYNFTKRINESRMHINLKSSF